MKMTVVIGALIATRVGQFAFASLAYSETDTVEPIGQTIAQEARFATFKGKPAG